MPDDNDNDEQRRGGARAAAMFVYILASAALIHAQSHYDPEPYHTSILTGQAWVEELLGGHLDRMQSELGVSIDVFRSMIAVLREYGNVDSRYVTLEEQLAVFLYTSVTGMSVRNVGERLQRSNNTVSK